MTQFISKVNQINLKTQVTDEVMRYIDTMDLSQNSQLPREEAFCKILGVSRITLRSVLDKLESEGIIFRKHGKGTFVNIHSINMNAGFNPAQEFSQVIRASGYTPKSCLIDMRREIADEEMCAKLEMKSGSTIVIFEKVYYADGKFCAYIQDYVNASYITQELDQKLLDLPIFDVLEQKFSIKILWDKVELATCLSNDIDYIHKILTTTKPLLLLKGVNYDTLDRPIFYGCEYIDTDVICFNQIRTRKL